MEEPRFLAVRVGDLVAVQASATWWIGQVIHAEGGARCNANSLFQIACIDTGAIRTVNADAVVDIVRARGAKAPGTAQTMHDRDQAQPEASIVTGSPTIQNHSLLSKREDSASQAEANKKTDAINKSSRNEPRLTTQKLGKHTDEGHTRGDDAQQKRQQWEREEPPRVMDEVA